MNEELEKAKKSLQDKMKKAEPYLNLQELLAELNESSHLKLKCKLDRIIRKIIDNELNNKTIKNKDFTPCLNLTEQLLQCYEDIINNNE